MGKGIGLHKARFGDIPEVSTDGYLALQKRAWPGATESFAAMGDPCGF